MGFDINQKHQKKLTRLLQNLWIEKRSEEVLLIFFCVFLIYIKTHNRMEINL